MVLRFIKDEDRLYRAIQIAFAGDEDLIKRFHSMGGSFEACVQDTFDKIIDASAETLLEWYEIVHDGEVIGYTVLSKMYRYLFSFGIAKNKRTRDAVGLWWSQLTCLLKGGFTCHVWAKNKRAIHFLMKKGMNVMAEIDLETQLNYN